MKILSVSVIAALVLGVTLTACSEAPGAEGSWVLDSFNEDAGSVTVVADIESTLLLAEGVVTGNGGVNSFNGTYALSGDEISFSALASTKMAGPPEAMDQEQRFFEALEATVHVEVGSEKMTLSDADNTALVVLIPAPGN